MEKSIGLSVGAAALLLREESQEIGISENWMCHSDNLDADGQNHDDSNLGRCSL